MKKLQFLSVSMLALAVLGGSAGFGGQGAAMQTTNPTPTATGPWWCGQGGGNGMMPGAMMPGATNQMPAQNGMMGDGWGDWDGCYGGGMGPGMMNPGMMDPSMMGPNMMGGMMGPNMMGGQGMMGPGMMGGMMGIYPAAVSPISEADAEQRLATFLAAYGSDLQVEEIMPFASNYYAEIADGSGTAVGEVLVDRYTGAVYPEPGPNMMWNGRWGMMPGAGAPTQYDEAAAQQQAEQFLTGFLPGSSVLAGTAFPGYYTFDYGRGQVEGMLSVNAATGEIWVHTWHGPALANGAEGTPTP